MRFFYISQSCIHILSKVFWSTSKQLTQDVSWIRFGQEFKQVIRTPEISNRHLGTLAIVLKEVLWSIRDLIRQYEVPPTNVKWHSDPWPVTVTSPTDQFFHEFHDLDTQLDLHRIPSGFHEAFATGLACQQGTLTLTATWFLPTFWNLFMLQLPCLFSTFQRRYPSALPRFCFWFFTILI